MGHGYTPYVFQEITKALKCRHEHFWDAYHVSEKIKNIFRKRPKELENLLFESIKEHDKRKTKTVLETTESLIEEDEEENFQKFKNKLLKNFRYTKPAALRGISPQGIGIMESQHCKIANRMKNQGMYWSVKGAETMAKMIIDVSLGNLRELFFGAWRKDYAYYRDLPTGANDYLSDNFSSHRLKEVRFPRVKTTKNNNSKWSGF